MARLDGMSLTVSIQVDETYMLESALDEARKACAAYKRLPWLIRWVFEWDVTRHIDRLEQKLESLDKARSRTSLA